MSSPPPASSPQTPEWYCHACSRTTRSPLRVPDLQCPSCRSDFLEELSDADDPRRIGDFPQDLPGPPGDAGPSPFHSILAQLLGAAGGPGSPGAATEDQDAPQQGQAPAFHFSFTTSGVDASGRRFTRTHRGPDQPDEEHVEGPPAEGERQEQQQGQGPPQPQSLNDFLNQAFQGNPNPHPPQSPGNEPGTAPHAHHHHHHHHHHANVAPMSMAGLLSSMLGGAAGGPAVLQTTGPDGQGGLQFIFNSTFGPMQGQEGGQAMQWGDALNSQGLDNFITALMNQAASNAEGPRRAPDELIHALPRKKLSQEDIDSFRTAECAVCKDDFAVEDDAITLPCSHVFHADCIVPWLERSGTCAVCRHELVPQPHPHSPQQQHAPAPAPAQPTFPGEGQPDPQQHGGQAPPPPGGSPRPHIVIGGPGQGLGNMLSRMFGMPVEAMPGGPAMHQHQTPGGQPPDVASGGTQDLQEGQQQGQEQQQSSQQERHDTPEQEPLD